MSTALSAAPVESVRRVDLFAYVLGLLGLSFVTGFAAGSDGGSAATLASAGAALAGLCVFLGAFHVRRHPENLRRGAEPAPVFLYLIAGGDARVRRRDRGPVRAPVSQVGLFADFGLHDGPRASPQSEDTAGIWL